MLGAGNGIALAGLGDVVDRKDQMIFRRDMARPLHAIGQPQQRDNVFGPGFIDGGVQAGEGTDVNHERYLGRRASN